MELPRKCTLPTHIASSSSMQPQHQANPAASDSASTSSNGTYSMSAVPGSKRFWPRSRAPAKTSLMHKFAQVVLNSSSTDVIENKEPTRPTSHSNRTLLRERLEMDVERLYEKLQQEMDLHSALENAIAHAAGAFPSLPQNLPVDAQELLADVAMLEVAVSSLEEQMIGLKMQICHERGELMRDAASYTSSPLLLPSKARQTTYMTSPHRGKVGDPEDLFTCMASLHEGKFGDPKGSNAMELRGVPNSTNGSQPCIPSVELTNLEEYASRDHNQCCGANGECTISAPSRGLDAANESLHKDSKNGAETFKLKKEFDSVGINKHLPRIEKKGGNILDEDRGFEMRAKLDDDNSSRMLWREPNRLSEEMVNCMIGIYCHLGDPSEVANGPKRMVSDPVPSPSSPFGQVTSSSFSSLSDMSSWSFPRSPLHKPTQSIEEQGNERAVVDPYSTHEKLAWGDIGSYGSAVEVSWMSVGKEQLEYAADALRTFRCLVEQLSRVDIATMVHNEKLAFWINIYNALMMHAYLAYGIPKNEVKCFALMQKAAYTVGGHFFNAVAIEHVLLRGKAPSYRPQIALLLALHKLKIPEGATKLAISRPEPLVMFALSHGAWSSPAVGVYRAETVQAQLQGALHEYVRASVGVSRQGPGKVLVPKLLHCYARELGIMVNKGKSSTTAEGGEEAGELINWVCGFLPAWQAAVVAESVRNQPNIAVQPFNSRLRYLFLEVPFS